MQLLETESDGFIAQEEPKVEMVSESFDDEEGEEEEEEESGGEDDELVPSRVVIAGSGSGGHRETSGSSVIQKLPITPAEFVDLFGRFESVVVTPEIPENAMGRRVSVSSSEEGISQRVDATNRESGVSDPLGRIPGQIEVVSEGISGSGKGRIGRLSDIAFRRRVRGSGVDIQEVISGSSYEEASNEKNEGVARSVKMNVPGSDSPVTSMVEGGHPSESYSEGTYF
jgi:hypothetical protein